MTQRLRAIWRLATLFVHEKAAQSPPPTPRSTVSCARSRPACAARGATSLAQRVPVLQNLSGVLTMASGLLAQHPGLAETAVRVALAELDDAQGAAERRARCAARLKSRCRLGGPPR